MQGNDTTDALFAILHEYDTTWMIIRESDFAVVIENDTGQQIHARNLELALRSAITLSSAVEVK